MHRLQAAPQRAPMAQGAPHTGPVITSTHNKKHREYDDQYMIHDTDICKSGYIYIYNIYYAENRARMLGSWEQMSCPQIPLNFCVQMTFSSNGHPFGWYMFKLLHSTQN